VIGEGLLYSMQLRRLYPDYSGSFRTTFCSRGGGELDGVECDSL